MGWREREELEKIKAEKAYAKAEERRKLIERQPLAELGLDDQIIKYAEMALGKKVQEYEDAWKEKYNALADQHDEHIEKWKVCNDLRKAAEKDFKTLGKTNEELYERIVNMRLGRFFAWLAFTAAMVFLASHQWESWVPWSCYVNEWSAFSLVGFAAGWRIGNGPARQDVPLEYAEEHWKAMHRHGL